jgi:hypothetical protein
VDRKNASKLTKWVTKLQLREKSDARKLEEVSILITW